MDQLAIEKRVTLSYIICLIAGATASITTGVAWGHWYRTLDQCVNRNCSCILYGIDTPSTFLGGGQSPCIWVTFGPLFYAFFCFCMTCFHGYRVLFTTKSPQTRTTRSYIARTEPGESIQIQAITQEDTSPLPKAFWVILSVFSFVFFIYSLIHFSIFLDGFYATCSQYRKTLEKMLNIHGTALPVIHSRLYCQGIFDFMDYMQLDSGNAYRSGFINTGLALTIGIAAAGVSVVMFFVAFVSNVTMAKRRSN